MSKSAKADARRIYGSCESIRKSALLAKNGKVFEVTTHAIGSVFCNPLYRGRGYAGRMMKELGPALRTWQADAKAQNEGLIPFSILYSDIGNFYERFGWEAFPSSHFEFALGTPNALPNEHEHGANKIQAEEVPEYCQQDCTLLIKSLQEAQDSKVRVALVPSTETMQWHHSREDFVTSKLFDKSPACKGAVSGEPGSRVWALFTRMYYGHADDDILYILRLVVEDGMESEENAQRLKAVLEIAKEEARQWNAVRVDMWNPTPVAKSLIAKTGLEFREVARDKESIPSLLDYQGHQEEIEWVANEKYGWC